LEPEAIPGNRMHFVRGDALVDWLKMQPGRLSVAQVADIARSLTPARRRKAG
jgi:hypothetical protein